MQALTDATADGSTLDSETAVWSVAMFDHEEVGSDSAQGAGGPVMRDTVTRVARQLAEVNHLACHPLRFVSMYQLDQRHTYTGGLAPAWYSAECIAQSCSSHGTAGQRIDHTQYCLTVHCIFCACMPTTRSILSAGQQIWQH
eukprot:GHRR01025061.1.p1 GENE.GHRR01025061.1~~GHRR01025061.1.p1  ORF type:complete len:142 (-),score=24.40 GHRR01025061.1:630-1055(-)